MPTLDDYNLTTDGFGDDSGAPAIFTRMRQRYELARRDKEDLVEHWRRNLAAYEGRKVSALSILFGSKSDDQKGASASVSLNFFQRHVRTMAAKILAQNPKPTALPASPSEDDQAAARAIEGLLSFIARSNETVNVEQLIVFYMVLYGTGVRRIAWNASADSEVQPDFGFDNAPSLMDSEDAADPLLIPGPGLMKPRTREFKGALEVFALDPHNIFVPPGVVDIRFARWAIQASDLHVEEVWERWKKEVSPAIAEDLQQPVLGQLMGNRNAEMTTVFEYWERPSKMHPKGLYSIMSQDQTVLHVQEDLPLREIPLAFSTFCRMPGRIWGKTPMFDARAAQSLVNRMGSKIAESLEHCVPKMLVTAGSLDVDPIPGVVMEVLHPKANMPRPEIITASAGLSGHVEFYNLAREAMGTIVGTESVGLGDSSSADASGRSILFLSAEANVSLAAPVTSYRESLSRSARLSLEFMKAYATEPLMYSILDEAGREDLKELRPEGIKYQDIIYQVESNDAYAKQAMRDTLTSMFQAQAIDKDTYVRLMDMPNASELYGADPAQRARAQAENRSLREEWGPDDPKDWEDHAAHAACHETFMRSEKFYALAPELQMRMMRHNLIHHFFMGHNPPPGDFIPLTQMIIQPQPQLPGPEQAGPEGPEGGAPPQPGMPPTGTVDNMGVSGNMALSPAMQAATTMPQANPAEELSAAQNVIAGPAL